MYERQLREFQESILYLDICEQIARQTEQLLIYKPNGNIYAGCYSGKVATKCGTESFYYTMYSLYGEYADDTYISISTCGKNSINHDYRVSIKDLLIIDRLRKLNLEKQEILDELYCKFT